MKVYVWIRSCPVSAGLSIAVHHHYRCLGVAKQCVNEGHSHSARSNDQVVGRNPFRHVQQFISLRVVCEGGSSIEKQDE